MFLLDQFDSAVVDSLARRNATQQAAVYCDFLEAGGTEKAGLVELVFEVSPFASQARLL
jgi:hypothetical protein